MKKITAIIGVLLMLMVPVGCNDSHNDNFQHPPATSQKTQYSEDQVLFMTQDRYDIEGDRYEVYAYNYKGDLLNAPNSSAHIGYYAENGLAPAADQSTGKVGFVDKDGVFQIEPVYDDAAPFSKYGIALVKKQMGDSYYETKCGYINSKGEEIVPCKYDTATSFFNCGYAMVSIEKQSNDPENYLMEDWKHCVIDTKGNVIIEIDVQTEKRQLEYVYSDYFICITENGAAIFDYANNQLDEIASNLNDAQYDTYVSDKDCVYKITYKKAEGDTYKKVKSMRFDGKKFIEDKKDYEILSKRVATTQSGMGYGIVKGEKTVVPFEYDRIDPYGEYFVAIKYKGTNGYPQTFDIYDKDYNKTAENLDYNFYDRWEPYGPNCQLPNGYFQIYVEKDYEDLYGIIDYTGKVIVEPIFSRGINLCTYEGNRSFEW